MYLIERNALQAGALSGRSAFVLFLVDFNVSDADHRSWLRKLSRFSRAQLRAFVAATGISRRLNWTDELCADMMRIASKASGPGSIAARGRKGLDFSADFMSSRRSLSWKRRPSGLRFQVENPGTFFRSGLDHLTTVTAVASLTLPFKSQAMLTFSPTFSVASLKPAGNI